MSKDFDANDLIRLTSGLNSIVQKMRERKYDSKRLKDLAITYNALIDETKWEGPQADAFRCSIKIQLNNALRNYDFDNLEKFSNLPAEIAENVIGLK